MRIGLDTLIENPRQPSSAIHYLKQLVVELAAAGPEHEFFVFVSPANRALFTARALNLHYLLCAASNENIPLRVFSQQAQYPLLARRHRLDVIHALNQIPLLAPCATVVKICTLHHHLPVGGEASQPGLGRPIPDPLRLVYRRLMHDGSARRATLVMANTQATQREIERLMRVPTDRLRVVYEAVDEAFGSQADTAAARAYVARSFGLARAYILFVSNLWSYKNPDGALRSFARLWARFGDDFDLVFAGPDDEGRQPALQQLALDLGVADRVRFLGRVPKDDLVQLYAGARVFFYPSFNETFGKPLVEAMRSGVPVVTAAVGCMPEVVGPAGLWADPHDSEGLAEALHRAATDETLRAQLRAGARSRARDFSWKRTAAGTLAMCAEAVRQHNTQTGREHA
jgi:glycosyltransferase involved in cell wall biosynthesis